MIQQPQHGSPEVHKMSFTSPRDYHVHRYYNLVSAKNKIITIFLILILFHASSKPGDYYKIENGDVKKMHVHSKFFFVQSNYKSCFSRIFCQRLSVSNIWMDGEIWSIIRSIKFPPSCFSQNLLLFALPSHSNNKMGKRISPLV